MAWNEIRAKIGLDATGFEIGAKRAASAATGLGASLNKHLSGQMSSLKTQIASVFTVGAIVGFTKSVVETATRIKDLSEQYGISTDQVQKYDRAAKMVGMTAEDVGAAIDKMGKARVGATKNDQDALNVFNKFGISLKELQDQQLTNSELFNRMAMAAADAASPELRTAFQEIFGKGGAKLIGMMKELRELGPIQLFSEDTIAQIDQADKAIKRLWEDAKMGTAAAIGALPERGEGEGMIGWWLRAWWGNTKSLFGGKPKKPTAQDSAPLPLPPKPIAPEQTPEAKRKEDEEWRDKAEKANAAIRSFQSTVFNAVARVSNPAKRRAMLEAEAKKKMDEAYKLEGEDKWVEAAALRKEAIGMASEAAGSATKYTGIQPDALAAVGGTIGGAGQGIDPSLTVQQDQLSVLKAILDKIGLKPTQDMGL